VKAPCSPRRAWGHGAAVVEELLVLHADGLLPSCRWVPTKPFHRRTVGVSSSLTPNRVPPPSYFSHPLAAPGDDRRRLRPSPPPRPRPRALARPRLCPGQALGVFFIICPAWSQAVGGRRGAR